MVCLALFLKSWLCLCLTSPRL